MQKQIYKKSIVDALNTLFGIVSFRKNAKAAFFLPGGKFCLA